MLEKRTSGRALRAWLPVFVAVVVMVLPLRGSAAFVSLGWVSETVDAPARFFLNDDSLQVDSSGTPHLAYGEDHLYYSHHDGVSWVTEVVDPGPRTGELAQLALDSADNAHICHFDTAVDKLLYTTNESGKWVTQTVAEGVVRGDVLIAPQAWDAAIDVDAAGAVHIVYTDGFRVVYTTNASGSFVEETLYAGKPGEIRVDLTLDSSGDAHVSFGRPTNREVSFPDPVRPTFLTDLVYSTNRSGRWRTEVVSRARPADEFFGTGFNSSLAVDAAGDVHIAHVAEDLETIEYATNASGSWVSTLIDGGLVTDPAIGLDDAGTVFIAYSVTVAFEQDERLRLARGAGSAFTIEDLVIADSVSATVPGLFVEGDGTIHAAQVVADDLRYVTGTPGSFVGEAVVPTAVAGGWFAIDTDASDDPHVLHARSDGLYYAERSGSAWSSELVRAEAPGERISLVEMELDDAGAAHACYVVNDSVQAELFYATNPGGVWSFESIAVRPGQFATLSPALGVDDSGDVHLAWIDGSVVRYATNASGSFVTETAVPAASFFARPHLDVDASGTVYLLHHAGDQLRLATKSGGPWSFEDVAETTVRTSGRIQVEASGTAHIIHRLTNDEGNGTTLEIYYTTNASGSWVTEEVGDAHAGTSFVVDAAGDVHLTVGIDDDPLENFNEDLFYVTNATGVWQRTLVDTGGTGQREFGRSVYQVREGEGSVRLSVVARGVVDVGLGNALAIDGAGTLHVAYDSTALGDLFYAVQSTGPAVATRTVGYATSPGSASAGTDYTTTSGTLGWTDLDSAARSITVPIAASDGEVEGLETLTVELDDPLNVSLGVRRTATIQIIDADIPANATVSYVLPRNIATRRSLRNRTRSRFVATGAFDTGPGGFGVPAGATLRVGGFTFEIPQLTPGRRGRISYTEPGLTFIVNPSVRQSSRGAFRLLLRQALGGAIQEDAPVSIEFHGGSVSGQGEVLLNRRGAYRLGRLRGSLLSPNMYLFSARATLVGPGRDSLKLFAGLAGLDDMSSAPDVHIRFGDTTFDIAGADFNPGRRGTFVFRGPKGGLTNVTLNPARELISIRGAGLDLGEFEEGPNPIVITIGVGDDSRTIAVRMSKKRRSLLY